MSATVGSIPRSLHIFAITPHYKPVFNEILVCMILNGASGPWDPAMSALEGESYFYVCSKDNCKCKGIMFTHALLSHDKDCDILLAIED